jgi:rod shape-determining protein MreD
MRPVVALLLFAFVALLLRSTALSALAARGIVLDVLAFVTVLWALRHGESWGCTFGFALGLFADLDAAHWLGRHAMALALVGYVVGRLSHSLVRDSGRTLFVLLFASTLVHQTWTALFEAGGVAAIPLVAGRVLMAAVASALVGTLLLGLLRPLGGPAFPGHASAGPGASA